MSYASHSQATKLLASSANGELQPLKTFVFAVVQNLARSKRRKNKYIKQLLVGELRARQAEAPDFEAVWRASDAQYLAGRRRYRNSMALVAAAVVALIVVLPPEDGDRETPD